MTESCVQSAPKIFMAWARQAKQGGFSTERAARTAMTTAIGDVQGGTWVDYPKTAVGEYLDQWLAGKIKLPSSTCRSYSASQ